MLEARLARPAAHLAVSRLWRQITILFIYSNKQECSIIQSGLVV